MQSSPLADDDVRSIVKLLGDIAGMNDALENKRRALVEGIARLIDADACYWALVGKGTPGERPTFSVYLKQGFGGEQFARYLRALEHPGMKGFNEPFFADFARNGHHITRLCQQIDPEGRFPRSDAAIGWREAPSSSPPGPPPVARSSASLPASTPSSTSSSRAAPARKSPPTSKSPPTPSATTSRKSTPASTKATAATPPDPGDCRTENKPTNPSCQNDMTGPIQPHYPQ